MCADPRLREQVYAQWRAERAARRSAPRGPRPRLVAGFPALLAAPLVAVAIVILLSL